jgi:hypothetical protein
LLLAGNLFSSLDRGLSDNAAILLYRIQLWMPKARVTKHDKLWVAKSREEWGGDAKRTPKQVKTALAELKVKGFIETAQMLFANRPILHVRLLEGTTHAVPKGTTHAVPKGTTLIEQEELQEDTTGRELSLAFARSLFSPAISKENKQEGNFGMASVADIAKLSEATKTATREKNKNLKVDTGAKETPGALHTIWAQTMGELGEHVGPMMGADGGMFKTLVAKCPPGSARVVLAFAVQNWNGFKTTLEAEYGMYKVSEKPVLPIMVKHADKLVTWWLKRQKQEAAHKAHQQASQAKAPIPPEKAHTPTGPEISGVGVGIKPLTTKAEVFGEETWRFEFLVDEYGLERAKTEWLSAGHKTLPAKYAEAPA